LRADTFEWHAKKARGLLLVFMLRQKRNIKLAKSFYQMRGTLFGTAGGDGANENESRSENKAALYE